MARDGHFTGLNDEEHDTSPTAGMDLAEAIMADRDRQRDARAIDSEEEEAGVGAAEDVEGDDLRSNARRGRRHRRRQSVEERIGGLRSRLTDEQRRLAEANRRIAELEGRDARVRKSSADAGLASLNDAIAGAERDFAAAAESGDVKEQAKLTVKLGELGAQRRELTRVSAQLTAEAERFEDDPETASRQQVRAPRNEAAERLANSWYEQNADWFNVKGYERETAIAQRAFKALRDEGVDIGDAQFFEELDQRIDRMAAAGRDRFGRAAGQEGRSSDQGRNGFEGDEGLPSAPVGRGGASTARADGTTGGGSRRPLSRETVEQAAKFGMTPEAYAKNAARKGVWD